jgi:hypothetical protein
MIFGGDGSAVLPRKWWMGLAMTLSEILGKWPIRSSFDADKSLEQLTGKAQSLGSVRTPRSDEGRDGVKLPVIRTINRQGPITRER